MRHYPEWLRKRFSPDGVAGSVDDLIADLQLATVCQSAVCPNLRECWSQRQLTFMILGETCTRSCRFCAVPHGKSEAPSADEPWRVAEAVGRLGLRHVVITSVARDDLADEGAGHFVRVLQAVREKCPATTQEVLVPDFHGRVRLVRALMDEAKPEVFSHNMETVRRLSPLLRSQADYDRSLQVLGTAAAFAGDSFVKSGLMVGLGETTKEMESVFEDLLECGVTHLTIGQYLRPDAEHLPVMEYVSPQRFAEYRERALELGFKWVQSGPFVRSSYHAVDAVSGAAEEIMAENP